MIYPINRLLEFDLGNPKSISMKIIVDSLFQYYGKDEYDEYLKIIQDRLIKIYFDKDNQPYIKEDLAKKRLNQFYKMIEKKREKRYKALELKYKENSYKLIKMNLYEELYKEVSKMCLPMEDKNIMNTIKQFRVDRLNLAILLKRMGKHQEAKSLLSIKESKIHTFSSYIKEWKEEKIKEYVDVKRKELKKILADVVDDVKKSYLHQEKLLADLNTKCNLKDNERKFNEKIVLLSTVSDIETKIID